MLHGGLILAVALFAAPETRLKFHLPEGWTDLSPDAVAARGARNLPQEWVEAARARFEAEPQSLLLAAHIDPSTGAVSSMYVVVVPCPEAINESFLEGTAKVAQFLGPGFVVRERSIVSIQGVSAGRLIVDVQEPQPARQLVYWIPGRESCAFLSFLPPQSHFEASLPMLDRVAVATTGVEPPLKTNRSSLLFTSIFTGSLSLLFGFYQLRKERRGGATPPNRSTRGPGLR